MRRVSSPRSVLVLVMMCGDGRSSSSFCYTCTLTVSELDNHMQSVATSVRLDGDRG